MEIRKKNVFFWLTIFGQSFLRKNSSNHSKTKIASESLKFPKLLWLWNFQSKKLNILFQKSSLHFQACLYLRKRSLCLQWILYIAGYKKEHAITYSYWLFLTMYIAHRSVSCTLLLLYTYTYILPWDSREWMRAATELSKVRFYLYSARIEDVEAASKEENIALADQFSCRLTACASGLNRCVRESPFFFKFSHSILKWQSDSVLIVVSVLPKSGESCAMWLKTQFGSQQCKKEKLFNFRPNWTLKVNKSWLNFTSKRKLEKVLTVIYQVDGE